MKGYIMGWLFEHGTEHMKVKQYATQVIAQVFNSNQSWGTVKVIDQALVGNHLWVVSERHTVENDETLRFIDLFLLSKQEQWGYKEIDEYGGPAYWDCPKRMLELAPRIERMDPSEWSKNWREGVIRHHNNVALKRKKKRIIKARIEYIRIMGVLQWTKSETEFDEAEKKAIKLREYLNENNDLF